MHEAFRVYKDRLITDADMRRFDEMFMDCAKKHFSGVEDFAKIIEPMIEDPLVHPNIFTSFCTATADDSAPYLPIKGWEQLQKMLELKLGEYNDTNAVMNLVLFFDAMDHVARCVRIIEQPRGNALLVGVGGSGKQSLARLAAFVCEYETFQITVS